MKSKKTDGAEEEGDYMINAEDVAIGELVGTGQFGTVYVAKYFGDFVAVKKQVVDAEILQTYLLREMNVLKKVQHENIMIYYGAYDALCDKGIGRLLCMVSEFCHGGDLLDLLLNHEEKLGWKFRVTIAAQVASAIDYMHQNNIVHRDIKSSNILLDRSWTCKICDFGLAREVDPDCSDRMTLCGTNEYMAPELLFDEGNYSYEVDIFSYGMVLLEILRRGKVGHLGFAERSPRSKFQLDIEGIKKMLETDAPESLVQLALQCVNDEQSNRPAGCDVLDWIQDLLSDMENDKILPPELKHKKHINAMNHQFDIIDVPYIHGKDNINSENDVAVKRLSSDRPDPFKNNKNGNGNGNKIHNQTLGLTPQQIAKLNGSSLLSSPSTSSRYDSCTSTPRDIDIKNVNTPPKIITPPRTPRTPTNQSPRAPLAPTQATQNSTQKKIDVTNPYSSPESRRKSIRSNDRNSISSRVSRSVSPITPMDGKKIQKNENGDIGSFETTENDFTQKRKIDFDVQKKSTGAVDNEKKNDENNENLPGKTNSDFSGNEGSGSKKSPKNAGNFLSNFTSKFATPTRTIDEFYKKSNHTDSEDSWGVSKASFGTRTLQGSTDGNRSPNRKSINLKKSNSLKDGGSSSSSQRDISPLGESMGGAGSGSGSVNKKLEQYLGVMPNMGMGRQSSSKKIPEISSEKNELSASKNKNEDKNQDYDNISDHSNPMQSEKCSLFAGEKDVSAMDEEVFKEGYIYKKNSTGFFRNWKKVHFRITKKFMRWTSSAGLNSKYYSLKGATIIKTLQFRFQVMNLTEVEGSNKYIHREFAADSYPDMDDWVRALQEAITRANDVEDQTPQGKGKSKTGHTVGSTPGTNGTGASNNQDNVTPSGDNCRDFLTVKSKSTSNLSCNADTDTEKAREKVGRERIRSANYSPNKIKIRKYFNRNKNNYEDRDNGTDTDKSSIRGNVNENNNTPGNGSVHSSGGANGRHSKIPRKIKKTWKDIPESPSSSSFSVGMWLEYMGLRQYEKTFLLSGYDTIESIQLLGLKDESLDFLGIKEQSHRNILQTYGHCSFNHTLEIRTQNFDSTIMSITSSLRHQVLQSYLKQLAIILENTEYFILLLAFLELVPSNTENKIKNINN